MATTVEQFQEIKAGDTSANISRKWRLLGSYDEFAYEIQHAGGTGAYKVGASNQYDPQSNPNPTPIDISATCTVIGGTLAVSAAASLMVRHPYPVEYKAICIEYARTSGGAANSSNAFLSVKG